MKGKAKVKKHPTLLKSFGYATRGLVSAVRFERNVRIHLGAALCVVLAGLGLGLVAWEWVAVFLCCAMVLGAEMMNTALETVVDLVSPEFNELAGRAKDVAAAAVWLTALFSALVGVLVFGCALLRLVG